MATKQKTDDQDTVDRSIHKHLYMIFYSGVLFSGYSYMFLTDEEVIQYRTQGYNVVGPIKDYGRRQH